MSIKLKVCTLSDMKDRIMGYDNYKFEDFICDESFINFAAKKNQLDEAKWEKWFLGNSENKQTALKAKLLIRHLRFKDQELSDDFVKAEWLKLKNSIKIYEGIPAVKKITFLRRKIWQYAAAASVLLLFIGVFYYFSLPPKCEEVVDYNEVVVPKGEIKEILLCDGTLVYINSDSKLKYKKSSGEKQREVFLEGEAYFDVKHNANKPFIVHTKKNDITVLGTAFNVFAYPDENIFRASLERGKILVSHIDKEVVELEENQTYVFNKDNNTSEILETSNIESYSSWKHGIFVFHNQRFIDILKKMERSHNVIFSLQNVEVGNSRFTGTFTAQDDIVTILEVLKIPTPFEYEILVDTILIK